MNKNKYEEEDNILICKNKNKICPFYTFVNAQIKVADYSYYRPIDQNAFERKRGGIETFYEFEDSYLGGHFCEMDDMVNRAILNQDVYVSILKCANIQDVIVVHGITAKQWFWRVLSLLDRNILLEKRNKKSESVVYEQDPDSFSVVVSSWLEAEHYGCMASYFGDKDVLGLFIDTGANDRFVYDYHDDYQDAVSTIYDKDFLYKKYRYAMYVNAITVPLWANTYHDPMSFSVHFERQVQQYVDVFSKCSPGRLNIVGDGPGTASLAAYVVGRQYVSSEPNGIGSIARDIGLITSNQLCCIEKNDILCLFNVFSHVSVDLYYHPRVIVIEQNFQQSMIRKKDKQKNKKDYIPLKALGTGAAKVYYRGVDIKPLTTFKLQNPKYMFTKDGLVGPVDPQDDKAKTIAQMCRIPTDDKAVKVTSDVCRPYLNLLTRNNPNDLRAKTIVDKNVRDVFVSVYPGHNRIFTNDSYVQIDATNYGNNIRCRKYEYIQGFYLVMSQRPERVSGIYDEDEIFIRLYLLYKIKSPDGKQYGVYRRYDNVTAAMYTDEDKKEVENVELDYSSSAIGISGEWVKRTLADY